MARTKHQKKLERTGSAEASDAVDDEAAQEEAEGTGEEGEADLSAMESCLTYGAAEDPKGEAVDDEKADQKEEEAAEEDGENGEDEEYTVAGILQERTYRNKQQYLVRWEGYGSDDDTWEPAANVAHCTDLLAEFKRKKAEEQAAVLAELDGDAGEEGDEGEDNEDDAEVSEEEEEEAKPKRKARYKSDESEDDEESGSDVEYVPRGKGRGGSSSRSGVQKRAKLDKHELEALGEQLGECEAPLLAKTLLRLVSSHPELVAEVKKAIA